MDTIDQKQIDWLSNSVINISSDKSSGNDTAKTTTTLPDEQKPKFVKLFGNNKQPMWFKVSENRQDGTEILVQATKYEILKWKLK